MSRGRPEKGENVKPEGDRIRKSGSKIPEKKHFRKPSPSDTLSSGNEESADRLEGRNPVLEALRSGRQIHKLWILKQDAAAKDAVLSRIFSLAKSQKIPIVEVHRNVLEQMSRTHGHQGVIAAVASHDYTELDEVLRSVENAGEIPFLLMLDGLKDGYNLGSILRIADAGGVHGVILSKHRSVGLDSLVAKASAGAIEYVPAIRETNLSQTILSLKKRGFWVAGTDADGQTDYRSADYSGPLLLVIGGEGEGITKAVKEKCDFLLNIPMHGAVNSLNAAVAAGIIVFEAQAKRGGRV